MRPPIEKPNDSRVFAKLILSTVIAFEALVLVAFTVSAIVNHARF